MNALLEVIKQEIFHYFVKSEKITFVECIINESLRTIPDYSIEMFTSILGAKFLETLGLQITSLLFFFFNLLILFILYIFPFQNSEQLYLNYSFFELISLIICYLILFVCVGGGGLLIYQKFVSNIRHLYIKESFFLIMNIYVVKKQLNVLKTKLDVKRLLNYL